MNRDMYNKILATNYNDDNPEYGYRVLDGYPMGCPTVKELINALKTLPEDYRVTCCGADIFIYIYPKHGYITIDNERYLDC